MVNLAIHLAALFSVVTAQSESAADEMIESAVAHAEDTCTLNDAGSCLASETISAQSLEMNMVDDSRDCTDRHHTCPMYAELGECEINPMFMLKECAFSCKSCLSVTRLYGVVQKPMDVSEFFMAQEMHNYMTSVVHVNSTFAKVKRECHNRHTDCLHWKAVGECEANPNYMTLHCAPACQTCHLLDFEKRCPRDPQAPQVWTKAGELDSYFQALVERAAEASLQPHVLSTPADHLSQLWDNPNVSVADHVVVDGPWVVTLENVLSEAECQHLIKLGNESGYRRSKDVGRPNFDGSFGARQSTRRTSTNAWCSGSCFADPLVQIVSARVEALLEIPTSHSEYWQILRYEVGQEYQEHHDYISHQRERNEGVRILTVFFYLNDVEIGGGTNFPQLNNLTVTPRTGRVLVWPSVLDSNPNDKDPRTNHRAMPVESGEKYGANAWVHQSDFRTPHHKNCA